MGYIIPYRGKTPRIDPTVFVAPTATVAGDVVIGEESSVWFGTVIRGDFQPVRIGCFTNLQDNVTVHVMGDAPTEIGSHVIVGHNALIHSRKIGDHCLIGMGAILLGYSEIGDNCIIGAGTLLTQHKKIPSGSLVYGNPAKIVRALRDDELDAMMGSSLHYNATAKWYMESLEKLGIEHSGINFQK